MGKYLGKIPVKFENIEIFVFDSSIKIIDGIYDDVYNSYAANSGVYSDVSFFYGYGYKSFTGRAILFFRNQGGDLSQGIQADFVFNGGTTSSEPDANTFCKVVQYFFENVEEHLKLNPEFDRLEKKFQMPEFLYSAGWFETLYPRNSNLPVPQI